MSPNNTIMEVTTPNYLGHHTLVCIFKKFCSEKATFDIFYEIWYENKLCFSCGNTSSPTKTKTTSSGWAQGEYIIKKKDHPNICFHRKVMSYFRNLGWPLTSKLQDGRRRLPSWISKIAFIFATEADIGMVFTDLYFFTDILQMYSI